MKRLSMAFCCGGLPGVLLFSLAHAGEKKAEGKQDGWVQLFNGKD